MDVCRGELHLDAAWRCTSSLSSGPRVSERSTAENAPRGLSSAAAHAAALALPDGRPVRIRRVHVAVPPASQRCGDQRRAEWA